MTEIIEQAEAAIAGTTEAPWVVDDHEDDECDSITVGAGTYLSSPGCYTSTDLIHEVDTYGDELDGQDYAIKMADANFIAWARTGVPELVAELKAVRAENERLHSWDGLLLILDQIYPETIFPTLKDDPARDSGPRIISLLRQIELIRDGAK